MKELGAVVDILCPSCHSRIQKLVSPFMPLSQPGTAQCSQSYTYVGSLHRGLSFPQASTQLLVLRMCPTVCCTLLQFRQAALIDSVCKEFPEIGAASDPPFAVQVSRQSDVFTFKACCQHREPHLNNRLPYASWLYLNPYCAGCPSGLPRSCSVCQQYWCSTLRLQYHSLARCA